MRVACLSGKGGAGKTMVAVNLATTGPRAVYIDCDVEEPNGRLFLKPQKIQKEMVTTLLPEFDPKRCSGCRECVRFCRFHALMYIKEKPMVFAEMCHSCGGCRLVCPEGAVTEKEKTIGCLEIGTRGDLQVITGILETGEVSGVPIIREALKKAGEVTVIDCPPGSACSVMESVMEADYCILVAEATAFGCHNVKMVYELVTLLGKKCGVVINKQEEPYEELERFCRENELPVLARISYDPEIARISAEGGIVSETMGEMKELFCGIWEKIGGAL